MSDAVSFLGLAAATLTTFAFVPQTIKSMRERRTQDVSLMTCLMVASGVLLWLVYGVAKGDLPLIVANAITLPISLTTLGLKLRHG